MATTLVDSPPAEPGELKPAETVSGAPTGPPADSPVPSSAGQACVNCGAAMIPGQDWCLQCGAVAPGGVGSPSWRSAAVILAVALVLALIAAGAGYAALTQKKRVPATLTTTVAAAPPPPAAVAPVTVPPATPGATKTTLPLGTVKPPKIPLTAAVPKVPAVSTPAPTPATPPTATAPSGSGSGGSETVTETKPTALLLDTNAASTYNPYNYPASGFGDPSLTIDGETSTGWTAQVEPTTAPRMAVGVLIDLKGRQKVAALKLTTSTPGMTVQVYGDVGRTAPASITDPAWVPLSRAQLAKKRHLRLKLKDATRTFNFITLWISRAPASAVGTPQAPGHVSVNEIELFPNA